MAAKLIFGSNAVIKLFFIVVFCCFAKVVLADLPYYPYRLELKSPKTTFGLNETMEFMLQITNLSSEDQAFLVPGSQNKGLKMIYFSFFSVDEKNYYTEVAREAREIKMDTSKLGSVNIKNIAPMSTITIPLFINDTLNYSSKIEAHHAIEELKPGKYKVLVWYYPWDEAYAQYAFNKISKYTTDSLIPDRTNMGEDGTQSNYTDITLTEKACSEIVFSPTNSCPLRCTFCHHVEHQNWSKLERYLRRKTSYSGHKRKESHRTFDMEHHRSIAYISDWPDAILASLPSYTGRTFIFRVNGYYHYVAASWQIGKINRLRSFSHRLFYYFFRLNFPRHTSNSRSFKLMKLRPY